ncbi:MAG: hypothetical protein IPH12_11045 [Saprospirales bacterium]|nr:hypothetical protein [Saprospirales bacterium]MBK8922343.1 hypothetical protein [Saprospirales bacterium]
MKKEDNVFARENEIHQVVDVLKSTKIVHPGGLILVIEPGVFLRDTAVEILEMEQRKLAYASRSFLISSTELSNKPMEIWVRLAGSDLKHIEAKRKDEKTVPFIEINHAGEPSLIGGRMHEHTSGKQKEVWVIARCEPFQDHHRVSIGGGVLVYPTQIKSVFHPVQHQFKIHQLYMEQNDLGFSRRRDSAGNACHPHDLRPQRFYPACYPASWASLCSAYQLTPLHPRRAWAMGTPIERNPPPNETGDFFSTWSMGTEEPGDPPPVTRVVDWQAIASNPTPDVLTMESVRFPLASGAGSLATRAELIKCILVREVGGQSPPTYLTVNPRPVQMNHAMHAWVIVGVEENGFWEHAMNPDSWAFSSFCSWDQAPWITDGRAHNIYFPPAACALKPENRRLGCIGLEGSSDFNRMKRIRFWDTYTNVDSTVFHWTPHTRTDPGYLWVRGGEPLTCFGFPETPFDSDLGHSIPRPTQEFGHCWHCGNSAGGCKYCRLRLLLPFWVHNTTLDELVTYKVDLFFWSKDQRWVSLQPNLLPATASNRNDDLHCGFHGRYWNDYKLPGPISGQQFSIQATPDTNAAPSQPRDTWNSQGFGWYIDFHRDQLRLGGIHGIKLLLTCIFRGDEPLCQVQDVKEIWFRVTDPGPG